jgi:hypothetical protein
VRRIADIGGRTGVHAIALLVAGAVPWAAPAAAQDEQASGEIGPPAPEPEAPAGDEGFFRQFFDDEDGKLDFSKFLAKGGFIPVPIIISEPAVDGGFGLAAAFLTADPDDPRNVTRRIAAAFKTGNGSYGYGYFQSGQALDNRVTYKFGVGRGKVNLTAYPRFATGGIEYTNEYKYGVIATARWHLADERISVGPIIDFRRFDSQLDVAGAPPEYAQDFGRTLTTGAVGLGAHFDSRDNRLTPSSGVNAFVDAKFNRDELGSDRNFEIYDADFYLFHRLSPEWRLAAKAELDAARGRYPTVFAPYIDQRGIEAVRYQGETVLSSEAEVTWQLSRRWSLLAFGGYGRTDSGGSRVFENSGAIVSGGGGIRYRIARKLGLDAGVDLAVGPEGTVIYLQFGHAWGLGMD